MELETLKPRPDMKGDEHLEIIYRQFDQLLNELSQRELNDGVITAINTIITDLNAIADSDAQLKKQLRKKQFKTVTLLEKEQKLVVKNHYRNTWLVLGMAAFGIPLGLTFAMSLGNMAFIGIGIPIGLALGLGIGSNMDKKAAEEGRQLQTELKY